ncbi:hypothetical protein [Candidatus Mycobacterium methanotrophicum]|uniref:Uncharacterized protein n=1 Tax=Candidatus Mycobacterium methanotrophicum TaxID=2943498 RepID=A0ABY4QGP0_9MYCO|nr:hypothetical protein [Candidatus Mycobacterium methanotrophicum]UQX10182.1 hypothetical protein M5I08_18625 [Candidatus Mycobacterium methanotrophicum]
MAPSGRGGTATRYFEEAHADRLLVVLPLVVHADGVANIAAQGSDNLLGARAAALETIAQAEEDDFAVGEDLSVADNHPWNSPADQAARQAAAIAHRNYIAHCAGRLEAENLRIATQLDAGAAEMAGMVPAHWRQPHTAFGQPAPREPNANNQDRQGSVHAVGHRTWKQDPPTPSPGDPNAPGGPLKPVRTGQDVKDLLRTLEPGVNKPHRQVEWPEDTRRLYDWLVRNSVGEAPPSTYPGQGRVLDDGTVIQIREGSTSGGPTIDVTYPDGSTQKVHLPLPIISPPPELPPVVGHPPVALAPPQVGHPAQVPLPPTQVVEPATLPPWLQNPSPPGFTVTPAQPPLFPPWDDPGVPAAPAPAPSTTVAAPPVLPPGAIKAGEEAAGAGGILGIGIWILRQLSNLPYVLSPSS